MKKFKWIPSAIIIPVVTMTAMSCSIEYNDWFLQYDKFDKLKNIKITQNTIETIKDNKLYKIAQHISDNWINYRSNNQIIKETKDSVTFGYFSSNGNHLIFNVKTLDLNNSQITFIKSFSLFNSTNHKLDYFWKINPKNNTPIIFLQYYNEKTKEFGKKMFVYENGEINIIKIINESNDEFNPETKIPLNYGDFNEQRFLFHNDDIYLAAGNDVWKLQMHNINEIKVLKRWKIPLESKKIYHFKNPLIIDNEGRFSYRFLYDIIIDTVPHTSYYSYTLNAQNELVETITRDMGSNNPTQPYSNAYRETARTWKIELEEWKGHLIAIFSHTIGHPTFGYAQYLFLVSYKLETNTSKIYYDKDIYFDGSRFHYYDFLWWGFSFNRLSRFCIPS